MWLGQAKEAAEGVQSKLSVTVHTEGSWLAGPPRFQFPLSGDHDEHLLLHGGELLHLEQAKKVASMGCRFWVLLPPSSHLSLRMRKLCCRRIFE